MGVINEIISLMWYFLQLTFQGEILWAVLPLAIATIIIVFYLGIYQEELGWNSYLSNSLVLMFVSLNLFRYLYFLNGEKLANVIDSPVKFALTAFIFVIGWILVKYNFSHVLPERIARHLSSPLAINLIAYAVILFVYSDIGEGWIVFLSLFLMILLMFAFLTLLRIPLKRLKIYLEREKRKERIHDIKEAKYEVKELKEELKRRGKELKRIKNKEIKEEEKQVKREKKVLKNK